MPAPEWLAPDSLEEALALKAEHGDEATVVAGGTFLAILLNQRFLAPQRASQLARVSRSSSGIEANGDLRLGAHGDAIGRSSARPRCARAGRRSPARSRSSRARASATRRPSGGVLADADYASDPPAMLSRARGARARQEPATVSARFPLEELITGHYETSLQADELIVDVRVPRDGAADVPQVPLPLARGPPVRRRRCRSPRRLAPRGRRRGRSPAAVVPRDLRARRGEELDAALARDRRALRPGDRPDSPTFAARPSTGAASSRVEVRRALEDLVRWTPRDRPARHRGRPLRPGRGARRDARRRASCARRIAHARIGRVDASARPSGSRRAHARTTSPTWGCTAPRSRIRPCSRATGPASPAIPSPPSPPRRCARRTRRSR